MDVLFATGCGRRLCDFASGVVFFTLKILSLLCKKYTYENVDLMSDLSEVVGIYANNIHGMFFKVGPDLKG